MESVFRGQDHNPRPPLLAGDARRPPMSTPSLCRFQSAPAIAGGRCNSRWFSLDVGEVSIRARHCWRAMPRMVQVPFGMEMFQSAPAIAGGRCQVGHQTEPPARSFNPRPPLLAGDARLRQLFKTSCRRFNPRPPLLAGDAASRWIRSLARAVSIRARHCWRAMRVVFLDVQNRLIVSIRARHCWRAMLLCFAFGREAKAVSIRARHCWRAMPLCRSNGRLP